MTLADRAVRAAAAAGMPPDRVFLDPVCTPIATTAGGLGVTLDTLRGLLRELPAYHRIGGLSNISFGLPLRRLLNRTFLPMAVQCGLSAVICDPTDSRLMESLRAAEAITGLDAAAKNFLRYYRSRPR